MGRRSQQTSGTQVAPKALPRGRDVGTRRRDQVVDAAVAIIAERGIQHLSLSEIEKRTRMARGHLTYYFPTKEEILLAVFDRLLQRMHQHFAETDREFCSQPRTGWEWVEYLLTMVLTRPPVTPEFGPLQYTFLAQMSHREDFRQRLATLYESWRSNMTLGLGGDLAGRPSAPRASPRALATLVQAILHGLEMQRHADPDAFDGPQMRDLCLDVLGSYLGLREPTRKKRSPAPKKMARNGKPVRATPPA
jgi:AcrR family transcriptional regulator